MLFALFCIMMMMMIPFLFSKDRQNVHLGGKGDVGDLGGTGKGEVVIRIYCMKKLFSIKEKKSGKKQNKQKIPPPKKKATHKSSSRMFGQSYHFPRSHF